MRLTWLGTASLLLEAGDTVLAFDPFPGLPLDAAPGGPVPDAARYAGASAVFVTHGHFDHILYIPALYGDKTLPVYATETPCATLRREGFAPSRLRQIAPGWEGTLGPFRITALQSRHCRFDAALVLRTALRPRLWAHPGRMLRLMRLNRRWPENGETLLYDVTDGEVRVQLLGSLGLDPDTDCPPGADALVLPFQGRSDPAAAALPVIERLRPRSVLLDHWDDAFPPMSACVPTAEFAALVRARLGIPCRALTKYGTLTIKAETT